MRTSTLLLGCILALSACGGDLSGSRDGGPSRPDAGERTDGGGLPDDDGGEPDGGVVPGCEDGLPPGALAFDGSDDRATMGVAPELGLERFTVEAWVRRDGLGAAVGTGMRVWELSPANGEMTVRTYSPTADVWETDGNSEFTLQIPLRGTGEFMVTARVEGATSTASVTLEGLEAGRVYEWYATVSDCAHTTRTPIARFATAP